MDTINIFKKSGLIPHDIIIMKNMSPFAPLQAGKVAASRKTAKIHEYILVFRKAGDYVDPPSEIIKEAKEINKFW